VAVAFLLAVTIVGSRALRVGWRTNGLLYLASSVLAAGIVFGDPLVGRVVGDDASRELPAERPQ
jgi:hypothetical protein